jgi:pSer/pThr/pTyr-binding forkhead associated (FHA) protein
MYSLLKANEERVALAMRRLGAPLPDRGAAGTDSNQPQDGPTGTGEAFSTQPPIEPIMQGVEPVTAPAATPEAWILEGEGISFRLDREGEYIVGRDPECDLLLSDATVSRKHAAIRFQQNDLRVEDLGSTNGTMVNGRRIEGGASLQDGDVIHFGRLTIRVYRKGASR